MTMRHLVAVAIAACVAVGGAQAGCALGKSCTAYSVKDFGAKGDGATKDTAAVQKALDACATTGGRVTVPPGTYLIGSIYLGDRTELHLEKGATLLGSPDLNDYNAPDAYPQNWGSTNEGWSAKHLILALEKRNVAITGEGTIDGNGRAFFDDKPSHFGTRGWRQGGINARGKRSEQRRPGQEIVFIVTVRNGIRNLNTDAFDVDSCRNVRIGDCDIVTGDDAIAIRGNPARLKDPTKVCENVRVSNIVCRVSADGVRVGVGNGTIRDVRVSNMRIESSGRGLHVQCCYGKPKEGKKVGVDISDVTFENITIRDTAEAVCVTAGSPTSTAKLKDIRFVNVTAESFMSPVIYADGETTPENVTFDRCRFSMFKRKVNDR